MSLKTILCFIYCTESITVLHLGFREKTVWQLNQLMTNRELSSEFIKPVNLGLDTVKQF